MLKTVPLVAGPVLGTVGKAMINKKNKLIAVEFKVEYADIFTLDRDLYTYTYDDLPEPHILMRPIPATEGNW